MDRGRFCTTCVAILAAFFLLPIGVLAQDGDGGVQSARINARLQPNGTLSVTEDIDYSLGEMPRTGFVRRLAAPSNGSIEVNSVARDGLQDEYRTTQAGQTKRVIIGTEGVEITGEHSYKISYTISNSLVHGDDTAQLVWSVVDNNGVTAENISINFSSPLNISNLACRIEPQKQGCPVEKTDTGFTATLNRLSSGESLVLQATLPVNQLSYNPPSSSTDEGGALWLWLSVSGLVLAGCCFAVYRWFVSGDSHDNTEPTPDRIDSLS